MTAFRSISWARNSKGIRCHHKRCEEVAVSNRLCGEHNAKWLGQLRTPAMPDYGDEPEGGVREAMKHNVRLFKKSTEELASWPMRSLADLERMTNQVETAHDLMARLRDSERESVLPLISEIRELRAAHKPAVAAIETLLKAASERCEDYRRREGGAARSGIPAARHPVASTSKKRKTGRDRDREVRPEKDRD